MTPGRDDAEHVDVQITVETAPSPVQLAAWHSLWRRLLSPESNRPTPAGKAEVEHAHVRRHARMAMSNDQYPPSEATADE
jgi:hypothetical protein